jgi:hypothetical protein
MVPQQQQQPSQVLSTATPQSASSPRFAGTGTVSNGSSSEPSSTRSTLDRPQRPTPISVSSGAQSASQQLPIQQQVQSAHIQQQVVHQTQQGLAQTQPPTEYVRSTSRFTVSTEQQRVAANQATSDNTTCKNSTNNDDMPTSAGTILFINLFLNNFVLVFLKNHYNTRTRQRN